MTGAIDRRRLLLGTAGAAAGLAAAAPAAAAGPETARDGVRLRRLTFRSPSGVRLAGELRTPARGRGPWPAVLVVTTMTGTKDLSVVTNYAIGLARRGFATFAFDQRGFGESGGRLRQHEDVEERMADLVAAVSLLTTLPAVDGTRIAVSGVSLGGGLALRLAAFDPRVSAFAAIAAGITDPLKLRENLGGAAAYRATLEAQIALKQEYDLTGRATYVPIATESGEGGLFAGADTYAYYTGENSRLWRNRATAMSLYTLLVHDVLRPAELTEAAGVFVVGELDRSTPVADHRAAYDLMSAPRRLEVLEGVGHFELYDSDVVVPRALGVLEEFFREHLG